MPREIVVGDVVRYIKPPPQIAVSDFFEKLEGLKLVVVDSYVSSWDGIHYLKFNNMFHGLGFAAQFFKIVGGDDYTLEEITA